MFLNERRLHKYVHNLSFINRYHFRVCLRISTKLPKTVFTFPYKLTNAFWKCSFRSIGKYIRYIFIHCCGENCTDRIRYRKTGWVGRIWRENNAHVTRESIKTKYGLWEQLRMYIKMWKKNVMEIYSDPRPVRLRLMIFKTNSKSCFLIVKLFLVFQETAICCGKETFERVGGGGKEGKQHRWSIKRTDYKYEPRSETFIDHLFVFFFSLSFSSRHTVPQIYAATHAVVCKSNFNKTLWNSICYLNIIS